MKILTLLFLTSILFGCGQNPGKSDNITKRFNLPPELKHCKIYTLISEGNSYDGYSQLQVVHCPHSTTTTTHRSGMDSHISRSSEKSVTLVDGKDSL